MNTSDRIAHNTHVAKLVGRCWQVGQSSFRTIKGKRCEEMPHAHYVGDLQGALVVFSVNGPVLPHLPSGDDLRRWRENAGLRQEDLSRLADVAESTIREMEHGRSDPHVSTLGKIVEALYEVGRKLDRERFLSHEGVVG